MRAISASGVIVGVAVGLALVAASCGITHRSGDYACVKQSDCSTGRTCQDGFCVLQVLEDGGMKMDGGSGSNGCPAGCTSCNVAQHMCDINCQSTSCSGQVTCPAGYHCTIECDQQNSCRNGVNCRNALSCALTCSGQSSCIGVECGQGPCDVQCTGAESCQEVSCGTSCACDVVCTNPTSCASGITCTSIACRNGSGCTSQPAFCHSC